MKQINVVALNQPKRILLALRRAFGYELRKSERMKGFNLRFIRTIRDHACAVTSGLHSNFDLYHVRSFNIS